MYLSRAIPPAILLGMRCLGRTKKGPRCKEDARRVYPFCRHHRWQPWALLLTVAGVVGLIFGLYRDAVEPLTRSEQATAREVARKQLCATVHGLFESVEAMAHEIEAREGYGRSRAHDVFDQQLASIVTLSYQVADLKVIDASKNARLHFVQAFALPDAHENTALLRQKMEFMTRAWDQVIILVEDCKAHNLYNFPVAAVKATPLPPPQAWVALTTLIYSDEMDEPLSLDDRQRELHKALMADEPIADIRRAVRECCRQSPPCDLLPTTTLGCRGLQGKFAVIAVQEYYLGGLVFTLLYADPPHRVMFVRWHGGELGPFFEEAKLTEDERTRLVNYYQQLLSFARTYQW